jgi:hypothetical protein
MFKKILCFVTSKKVLVNFSIFIAIVAGFELYQYNERHQHETPNQIVIATPLNMAIPPSSTITIVPPNSLTVSPSTLTPTSKVWWLVTEFCTNTSCKITSPPSLNTTQLKCDVEKDAFLFWKGDNHIHVTAKCEELPYGDAKPPTQ